MLLQQELEIALKNVIVHRAILKLYLCFDDSVNKSNI